MGEKEKPKDEGFCNDCPHSDPGESQRECHRLPPAACSHNMAFQWKFPQVGANWWCSEHPARQESIMDAHYEREAAREKAE